MFKRYFLLCFQFSSAEMYREIFDVWASQQKTLKPAPIFQYEEKYEKNSISRLVNPKYYLCFGMIFPWTGLPPITSSTTGHMKQLFSSSLLGHKQASCREEIKSWASCAAFVGFFLMMKVFGISLCGRNVTLPNHSSHCSHSLPLIPHNSRSALATYKQNT